MILTMRITIPEEAEEDGKSRYFAALIMHNAAGLIDMDLVRYDIAKPEERDAALADVQIPESIKETLRKPNPKNLSHWQERANIREWDVVRTPRPLEVSELEGFAKKFSDQLDQEITIKSGETLALSNISIQYSFYEPI